VSSIELETRTLLGRNVIDSYGRNIGRVIGIDRNDYGELEAVQVESVAGQVISAKTRQLTVTPKTVSVIPDWKVETNDIVNELSVLYKRLSGLGSLRESGEIPVEIYTELLENQKKGYNEKLHAGKLLLESMHHRLNNTESQISSLSKYLATVKLDYKSGIIDISSLQIAEQSINPSLQSLILEKRDLVDSINRLEHSIASKK
jgi:hypothetical protein